MTGLTTSQLNFIKKINISSHELFDASGMKTWEWKQQMKGLGKLVAFGVYPCAAKGHTLRTRAGHCIQCNTANLSYLKRMNESADVYVAWSKGSKLVKIGLAKNAYERLKSINKFKYGGTGDWELKMIYECENAGEIELKTLQALAKFTEVGLIYRNGSVERYCSEVFRCKLKTATEALETAVSQH